MSGGVTGEIASGELSASLRAIARAVGIPSIDEHDSAELLNFFHGQWKAGGPTTGFAQMAFFVEEDGHFGDGEGFAVTVTNATWDGSGTREINLVGAFADFTFYEGAFITVTSGTGWTGAERYLIESKTDDDQIILVNADSIDTGTPFPAGTNSDLIFTISTRSWASIQVPVPGPVGPSAGNPERGWPAPAGGQVPNQSYFWNYPTASLPAGALTSGAVFAIHFTGRIKVSNVAKRPNAAVLFYLSLDPIGSVLVQDNRRNNGQVGSVRSAIIGWKPGTHTEESTPFKEGTISDLGGKMLVTMPLHSVVGSSKVYVSNAPLDADLNQGDIDDLEEGRVYWLCLDDVDAAIVDPENSFTLSTTDPADVYTPVAYNVAPLATPGKVCISRPSFGSFRRLVWPFRFTASEQTELDGYQYVEGSIVGYADGTTADNELGVIWKASLHVIRPAEQAVHGANNFQKTIAMGTADRVATGAISRTTPGNTMNTSGSGTEGVIGAPLYRVKTNVYTDGLLTQHHAYANSRMDWGGNWDVVEIDSRLHGEQLAPGGSIVMTAGAFNAANRTIQQAGVFTSYAFTDGDKFRVTGGTGMVAGYYAIEAKETNGRIKLKTDARLPLVDNADTTGDIDEFPLVSYLGEESGTAQVHQLATATAVFRGATYLGHVVHHDNQQQQVWVSRQVDGESVKAGDVLTLKTFRRERAGGTGSWGFQSGTAIREYTVTAGRVSYGPQDIPLSFRIAVNGPPNSDCELEVRQGCAVLMRHRSR